MKASPDLTAKERAAANDRFKAVYVAAVKVAKGYCRDCGIPKHDWDDAIAEVGKRLWEASMNYDPQEGEWEPYAFTCVRGALKDAGRINGSTTRRGIHVRPVPMSSLPTDMDSGGRGSNSRLDNLSNKTDDSDTIMWAAIDLHETFDRMARMGQMGKALRISTLHGRDVAAKRMKVSTSRICQLVAEAREELTERN